TQTHPADLPTLDLRVQFEDRVSLSPNLQTFLQRMIATDVAARPESAKMALQSLSSPQAFLQRPKSDSTLAKRPITPTQLLLDAVWQSIRSGVLLGAICGGIFPGIFFITAPHFLLFMALIGAASGALLGAANGLLLGILTWLFYFPLTHLKPHRTVGTIASIALGMSLSLISLLPLFTSQSYSVVFVPTVVVIGLLMGVPSYKIISRWHQQPGNPRRSEQASKIS
ncbi:MAG: hypothetical protein AAGF01_26065, partial [Cyanobacteria bacterium P01_G01_bin.38]